MNILLLLFLRLCDWNSPYIKQLGAMLFESVCLEFPIYTTTGSYSSLCVWNFPCKCQQRAMLFESLCDWNSPYIGQPSHVIWVCVTWTPHVQDNREIFECLCDWNPRIYYNREPCYLSLCVTGIPVYITTGSHVIWASVWRWPGRPRRPVWRWRGTESPGCMHCCRYDQTASPATDMSKIIYRNYINIS